MLTEDTKNILAHFRRVDPILYSVAKVHAKDIQTAMEKRARRGRPGTNTLFASLVGAIISQQLATKAADSIWNTFYTLVNKKVTPEKVLATSLPTLRKAGLSNAKAKTIKALAKEIKNGLSLRALSEVAPEEATAQLTKIWGIGPWTSEMFLMFGLQHPDIFSVRDLGLVRSMEEVYGLKKDASHIDILAISQKWSPYRTFTSRVLWRVRDSKTSTRPA